MLAIIIIGRRQWQPTPVFLPGESHGQRILVGCSPWGRTESDTTEATSSSSSSSYHHHYCIKLYCIVPLNPRLCSGEGTKITPLALAACIYGQKFPLSLSSDWHLEVSVFLWKICWHISPEGQSRTAKFLWPFIRWRLCSLMLHFVVTLHSSYHLREFG